MPNIIPKSSTYLTILACVALIIGTALFFHSTVAVLINQPLFLIPLIVLVVGFVVFTIRWLVSLSDPAYEYFSGRMWMVVIFAAITILWIGCWSAQHKEDASDHIEYNGK